MSRILIIRNIQRNVLRTGLTVLGIMIGVTAVIGILSISMGLRESMNDQVEKLGSNFVMVMPGGGGMSSSSAFTMFFREFTDREKNAIEGLSGVESVMGRYSTSVSLEFKDKRFDTRVGGVEPEGFQYFIDKGMFTFDQGSMMTRSNEVMMGMELWKRLDKPGIGQSIYLGGKKFKLSGVLGESPMGGFGSVAMIPMESAWELAGKQDVYSMFFVSVNSPDVSQRIDQRLKLLLGEDEYSVLTNEQLVEQAQQMLGIIDGFLLAITSVSLIVGVLGVANTMFVSITERIRQIGVMKTLGATNTRISSMVVQESAVISLLGAVSGIVGGLILGQIIQFVALLAGVKLRSFVPVELMAMTIVATVVLGALSALIPAWEAAKLDPVEALKL